MKIKPQKSKKKKGVKLIVVPFLVQIIIKILIVFYWLPNPSGTRVFGISGVVLFSSLWLLLFLFFRFGWASNSNDNFSSPHIFW
jgi:hypothetical protein